MRATVPGGGRVGGENSMIKRSWASLDISGKLFFILPEAIVIYLVVPPLIKQVRNPPTELYKSLT